MTFEEKQRLALAAEVVKLRGLYRQITFSTVELHQISDELERAIKRFEAIIDAGDIIDGKIAALDSLAATRRQVHESKDNLTGTLVDITRALGRRS